MGGNRIESLKKIVDEIILEINSENFENLDNLQKKLSEFDLASLNIEEKTYLINALNEIEKIVTEKKRSILKSIGDKEKLKKFI